MSREPRLIEKIKEYNLDFVLFSTWSWRIGFTIDEHSVERRHVCYRSIVPFFILLLNIDIMEIIVMTLSFLV